MQFGFLLLARTTRTSGSPQVRKGVSSFIGKYVMKKEGQSKAPTALDLRLLRSDRFENSWFDSGASLSLPYRILRNKIGSLHHLGSQSPYDVKHPASSLYNSLYPAAAAYTAAAAAYSSMAPPSAMQQGSAQVPSAPVPPTSAAASGAGGVKATTTPSPPVSGATCGMGGMRPHWPSSHTVSDLLGHVNMAAAGLPRHHPMQDANSYNYYMYFQSCGPQNNSLAHNSLPNHLSSSLTNGFSSPLANPLSNGLPNGLSSGLANGLTNGLSNGLQNGFGNPLSSMMSGSALTPQTATL